MISIVIPVWNQHDMTAECLEAVRANTQDYEIVMVDNGSDPPIPGATIRNETNLGFPVAVNQGIRAAKGDIIILLNNDVIVTPGWADRMLKHLETFSIIAPMANYCAGLQQEVILPTYNDDKELFAEASNWGKLHDGEFREVNFTIGFCMMFKKSLWEEIGVFDESIWPCSGEEIDFCFRARVAGHRIALARDVYVHHIGSVTFAEMERGGMLKYQETCEKNDAHLGKKWGKDFWLKQIGELVFNDNFAEDAVRLNLGCGKYPLYHFTNIDQYENVKPDVVADALNLPYEPESVDEIYCGHLLEHLTFDEGQKALKHWRRLLKPGGVIGITVPDFDVLARRYLANPIAEQLITLNELYIYSYVQESHHRYCYGEALLMFAMEQAGFKHLEKMPRIHPYFTSSADDQISIKGVK